MRIASFIRFGCLCLTMLVGLRLGVSAQVVDPDAAKGQFVFSVLNFVQWTPAALPSRAPIAIGVVSQSAMAPFERALAGKSVRDRRLVVTRSKTADGVGAVHVIFVAADSVGQLAKVVRAAAGQPVLTIAEGEPVGVSPTVINLFTANTRLAFQVNLDAADQAGLQLHANLLSLAKGVHSTRPALLATP